MIRALLILLAAACPAFGQVGITVMADTNRVVRTNFTIGNAQVTGLSALLDAKQSTNAALAALSTNNAGSLTNLAASNIVGTVGTASNITGILAISNGGTGSSSASNARTALGLGTAATNDATNFQAANTNLTALASGDGSSLTNLSGASNPTGDGGSLTNVAATNIVGTVALASNIVGTLSITNGGTGGTNATSGLANLLPAYLSNASKVLSVNTNETGVEWIAAGGGGGSGTVTSVDASGGSTGMNFTGGPITTNGTLTLGGTLAIGSGGTGAGDLTNARVNLLPAYTNNAGKVLALNTNATDLEWLTVATGVVQVNSGGTGATNAADALVNLTIITTNSGVKIGPSSTTISGVAIGNSSRAVSTNGTDGANGVAVGNNAYSSTNGVTVGHNAGSVSGVAIGNGALTAEKAIAIGRNSGAEPGIAIGDAALSYATGAVSLGDNAGTYVDGAIAIGINSEGDGTNAVQIGSGTNTTAESIQFRTAGAITTNEWATLAALSTYPTTNISVVGTNNTNTLVFSNGILTSVTSP